MKNAFLITLLMFSLGGVSSATELSVQSITGGGQVRGKGLFKDLLKKEMLSRGVTFDPSQGNTLISIEARHALWSKKPEAALLVSLTDNNGNDLNRYYPIVVICDTSINDGGNRTLSSSCVRKTSDVIVAVMNGIESRN